MTTRDVKKGRENLNSLTIINVFNMLYFGLINPPQYNGLFWIHLIINLFVRKMLNNSIFFMLHLQIWIVLIKIHLVFDNT